jgi:hypothetical protein
MASNSDKTPAHGLQGQSYLYDYGTSPNTRTAVSQKVRILAPVYGDNTALWQMGVLSSFAPSQSRSVEPVRGIGFGDQVAELVPSVTEPTTGSFERALLYLCNLWQATGYAAGIDGPVRSLAHHRWPFDIEQQLVFSTLSDWDLGKANKGYGSSGGKFDGGVKQVQYAQTTQSVPGDDAGAGWWESGQTEAHAATPSETATADNGRGHSAIITMYEACWFTSWGASFAKDAGMIMETGDVTVSDTHDFASYYGEFMATGNDPTIGQLGSIRYGGSGEGAFGSGSMASQDAVTTVPGT